MVISRLSFDGSPPGAQMAQGSLQGFNECPQGAGNTWDPNGIRTGGWEDGPFWVYKILQTQMEHMNAYEITQYPLVMSK